MEKEVDGDEESRLFVGSDTFSAAVVDVPYSKFSLCQSHYPFFLFFFLSFSWCRSLIAQQAIWVQSDEHIISFSPLFSLRGSLSDESTPDGFPIEEEASKLSQTGNFSSDSKLVVSVTPQVEFLIFTNKPSEEEEDPFRYIKRLDVVGRIDGDGLRVSSSKASLCKRRVCGGGRLCILDREKGRGYWGHEPRGEENRRPPPFGAHPFPHRKDLLKKGAAERYWFQLSLSRRYSVRPASGSTGCGVHFKSTPTGNLQPPLMELSRARRVGVPPPRLTNQIFVSARNKLSSDRPN